MSTKAIGYARVSTDQQEKSGLSLEVQCDNMRAYAKLYAIELVDILIETASSKTLERPGLQRALGMLANGEVNSLLVAKLDRLTRSVADLGALLAGPFAPGKCELFSVADQIDTRTANGRVVLNILMSISQWEREVISERTVAALAKKKEGGARLGRPRFGHRIENGAVVAVAEEQAAIVAILSLRSEGMTMRKIVTALAPRGHRGRTGRPLQLAQVCEILKNAASSATAA